MPIATEFDPELVIVSAGFDAADGDRIGGYAITPEGKGLVDWICDGACVCVQVWLSAAYVQKWPLRIRRLKQLPVNHAGDRVATERQEGGGVTRHQLAMLYDVPHRVRAHDAPADEASGGQDCALPGGRLRQHGSVHVSHRLPAHIARYRSELRGRGVMSELV